jgi:hypothetical protein
MTDWNVASAFVSLKGITMYLYSLNLVLNAIFYLCPFAIRI